jgi:ATP-binding cassette subfamily B protein/ATP-binding cassette subfamily C protein
MFQVLSYLDPFVEFMQLPNVKLIAKDLQLEKVKTIEFRNVSFTYPKSENLILNDISFKISKGEKIAIVGLNGAGKTTVIKLLCKFYPPESGEILINGININEYDYESYLHQMAVVFQDYRLFSYSIKENITNEEIDDSQILEVIKQVGLDGKITELPLGINSRLNKAYDEEGVELSGGQGQKVAIARALYKNASLVILDEPTSALDPIAEAEIYQKFNDLVQDKTAIYISHRMSSSVFCDYVLVLENGKVVSFDSHKNLMKETDSLYYKLFTTQAENYQLD